jgi:hypothetical protein
MNIQQHEDTLIQTNSHAHELAKRLPPTRRLLSAECTVRPTKQKKVHPYHILLEHSLSRVELQLISIALHSFEPEDIALGSLKGF